MDGNDSNRQEVFEKIASILRLNGAEINENVMKLMEPLLSGSVSYEAHSAMLEEMIAGLDHE